MTASGTLFHTDSAPANFSPSAALFGSGDGAAGHGDAGSSAPLQGAVFGVAHEGTSLFADVSGGTSHDAASAGGHDGGLDSFVFSSGGGRDVSVDVQPGDVLQIQRNINGLQVGSAADLLDRVHSDAHGNAVIDLGHGDSVTLHGVSVDDLSHDPQSFIKIH